MSNEKMVRKVLRTFSKRFADKSNRKKGIALKASCEHEDICTQDLTETMSLLAKNFKKTLKYFNKKSCFSGNNAGVNDKWIDKGWKNSKCRGSNSGFNQQNKGKGYNDDSDKKEGCNANVSNFVAFTSKISTEDTVNPTVMDHPSDNINDDEEKITKEELMANYQMLFINWSKLTHAYTTGETERSELVQKNQELTRLFKKQRTEICILEEKI
ncbi:hypothetical protein LIER_43116 [Lithospermum erythrorhizon]|uniref:Uncharacterized protein n=1 Tax=Lithospermum erythrorhizon TaxID=34254 RepID=A0AAV3PGG6_LITER